MAATSSVYHTMEPGQLFCTLTYKEGLIDKDETASFVVRRSAIGSRLLLCHVLEDRWGDAGWIIAGEAGIATGKILIEGF